MIVIPTMRTEKRSSFKRSTYLGASQINMPHFKRQQSWHSCLADGTTMVWMLKCRRQPNHRKLLRKIEMSQLPSFLIWVLVKLSRSQNLSGEDPLHHRNLKIKTEINNLIEMSKEMSKETPIVRKKWSFKNKKVRKRLPKFPMFLHVDKCLNFLLPK